MYTKGFKYTAEITNNDPNFVERIPQIHLVSIENKELVNPIEIVWRNLILLDFEMCPIEDPNKIGCVNLLQNEMDNHKHQVMSDIVHQYVPNCTGIPEYLCINTSLYASAYVAIAKSDDGYYMITAYTNDEKTEYYSNITTKSKLVGKITDKAFVHAKEG